MASVLQNQKNSNSNSIDYSLSFEDVSKLFPLPLSEAADILGVPTSVLKKLCNENGLERWPHRKYLAGKSIEEIKTEAVRDKKSKALAGNDTHSHFPGSHIKDKTAKSQGNAHQLGTKTTWRSHQIHASTLPLEASIFSQEFKYGFPSTGLSNSTNKWWGTASSHHGSSTDEAKTTLNDKDAAKPHVGMEQSGRDERGKRSLSTIRKRALDEGHKALKSGVLKKHGAEQLDKRETILLRRLFQST